MKKKDKIIIISVITVLVLLIVGTITFFIIRNKNENYEELEEVTLEWFQGENHFDCDALDYILNNRRIKNNSSDNYQNISHKNIYYDDIDLADLSKDERYELFKEKVFPGFYSSQIGIITIIETDDIFYVGKTDNGLEIVIEYTMKPFDDERGYYHPIEGNFIHIEINDDSILKMNSKNEYKEYFNNFDLKYIKYVAYFADNNEYLNPYSLIKKEQIGEKIVERLIVEDKEKYKNAEFVDILICDYEQVEYGFGYKDLQEYKLKFSDYGSTYQKYFAEVVIKTKDGYELKKIGLADLKIGEEKYFPIYDYFQEFESLNTGISLEMMDNISSYQYKLFSSYAVSRNLYDAIMSENENIVLTENTGELEFYHRKAFNYLVYDSRYKNYGNEYGNEMIFALNKKTGEHQISIRFNSVLLFAVDNLLDVSSVDDFVEYDTSNTKLYFGYTSKKVNGKYLYTILVETTVSFGNYLSINGLSDVEIYQFDWVNYCASPLKIEYGKNIIENNYSSWFIIDFE